MSRTGFLSIVLLCLSLQQLMADEADPFAAAIRATEPLTPGEQQESFTLPDGFSIELVASEPDIYKPMNMAFDLRGRLWVTDSTEYPYPAAEGKGRDAIRVIDDSDGDGKFDRVRTFASGLNIPIGILPVDDGVVAFSIPNIYHFRDTDGNGTADEKVKLYGPFGYERDTHGMNNAFRRGFDGWVYACHGFNNQSKVSGTDGHMVEMQSGNTYRFRLDGSRIEQFTWGQVNPFGMCFDQFGNLFTADCHSAPVYQLVRGGYYPSFGKPHDGLGFVPPMMTHGHGSTAIGGIAYCTGQTFPKEFQHNFFVGNVMTSRINRDTPHYDGSTILAKEATDLLSTSDPWFRPVDVRFGPDGALYVADFYNRIIGHYEVPLDHPGRDRHRGRIWRISYNENRRRQFDTNPDFEKLIELLANANLPLRLLATNALADRFGAEQAPAIRNVIAETPHATVRAHLLWVLYRWNVITTDDLKQAASDGERLVRNHAMRLIAEHETDTDSLKLARTALSDNDAFVRRSAADALGQHPHYENVAKLMELATSTEANDPYLKQTMKIALKYHLNQNSIFEKVSRQQLGPDVRQLTADVALAVKTEQSAQFLLDFVAGTEVENQFFKQAATHAARYLPVDQVSQLINLARTGLADDLDGQVELFQAIQSGLQQRGVAPVEYLSGWAPALANNLFGAVAAEQSEWVNVPFAHSSTVVSPWSFESRMTADGQKLTVVSSLPHGERQTGILQSAEFEVPEKLTFYLCGHLGKPGAPLSARNVVRLRDARSKAIIREVKPPRNDVADKIEWTFAGEAGTRAFLEIVDNDARQSFAWVAVAAFEPAVVPLPTVDPQLTVRRQLAAYSLVEHFRLEQFSTNVEQYLHSKRADRQLAAAAARAFVTLKKLSGFRSLIALLEYPPMPQHFRDEILTAIREVDALSADRIAADIMKSAPQRLQERFANALSSSTQGGERLLALIEKGIASPLLLQRPQVKLQLASARIADAESRIESLTKLLPKRSGTIAKLIAERTRSFKRDNALIAAGASIFEKKCANCHRIGMKGTLIGPQLDGIGNRGATRIIEDILDPNRNVDVAFRSTTFSLTDGRIVTGLIRKEVGNTIVIADNSGKEISLAINDIDERVPSRFSLMPENLGTELTEVEFSSLVSYLLSVRKVPASTALQQITAPPAELALDQFYQKHLDVDGFPIVSSAKVSDFALHEAAYIVKKMLATRPDILTALTRSGTRLAIMAPTELTTHIPEHSDLTPAKYWDRRARGLGPTKIRPAASCGEENLLGYPGDPYHAESILVHEFAHAIHHMGLNQISDAFDTRLKAVYAAAMNDKLWQGKYAANNRAEYWAEGVQSWFGTNRPPDHDHNHVDTRKELIEYDPRLAKLIRSVFGTNNWQYIRPRDRYNSAHLTGYDSANAPTFVWPKELAKQIKPSQ